MSIKINKHVFHGIYSNFGYRPSFSSFDKLWADYPIHTKRAVLGAKDLNSSNNKLIEFENEEAAFKWYKTTLYGKAEFEKLNFPDDFCKNYFTIPDTEFLKYKDYFHGMIKSIYFKWNYSIDYNGSHEKLNDCPCPSSSSSSSSSSSEDSSSPTSAAQFNTELMLNILKILEDGNISDLKEFSDYSVMFQNVEDEDCCYCPPCELPDEEKSKFKCSSDWNANFSVDIDLNTNKIFEIPEIETRLGAINFSRSFKPSFADESQTLDQLTANFIQLFKNNWELNPDWNITFKSKKEFPDNSTRINDPVILFNENGQQDYYGNSNASSNNLYISFDVSLGDNKGNNTKEIIDNQQVAKESTNFGEIKVKVDSKNAYFITARIVFSIRISSVCYIKSQKKFMCFTEIDSSTNNELNAYIEGDSPEEYVQLFPIYDTNISPLTIFSTNDLNKVEQRDETHYTCTDGGTTGLKLKKEKINIKIDEQPIEIEVYTPEKTEFKYASSKTKLSKTGCEDFDLDKNCNTDQYTKKWNFTKPTIEISSWKEDFSENNIFPPKVS